MVRCWLAGLFALMLLPGSALAQSAFVEGTDYQAISPAVKTSQPDKVVVTEIFWYGCPHCFRFEPYLERWSANLPDGVVFEHVPSSLNPTAPAAASAPWSVSWSPARPRVAAATTRTRADDSAAPAVRPRTKYFPATK